MSALIDVLSDLVNIIFDFASDIISFLSEFITVINSVVSDNPILGVLLILLLIKIIVTIKKLI